MAKEAKEAKELQVVTAAELHAAVRFVGKMETNLSTVKLPGVQMWWIPGEGLMVHYSGKKQLIPAAGVKVAYLD
jgi:hypothetical protein